LIATSADKYGMANNRLLYLTRDDWALLNARARRRKYTLGEEIIRQGTLTDSLYIVREGEASVELALGSCHKVLATLAPEDICGDMSFLEQGASTAAVIAKDTNVEADEITGADLRDLFQAFPRLASRFYQSLAVVLARRLRLTSKELAREMAISDNHRKLTRT
jgi:CRP-like cAMP-binding protein